MCWSECSYYNYFETLSPPGTHIAAVALHVVLVVVFCLHLGILPGSALIVYFSLSEQSVVVMVTAAIWVTGGLNITK